MADTQYRTNLSSPTIPTDPLLFGRSVIIKDRDQNYVPNLTSKEDKDKDIGVPQVIYAANVLPTDFGFKSVGFFGSMETCPGTPYIAFPVRSTEQNVTLIHTTEGHLYRLKKPAESTAVPQFVYVATVAGVMTYAHVSGVTYLYVAGVGCYVYDFATGLLVPTVLEGLEPTAILGITATGGYLLAWSSDALAWSSLLSATDFVPSLDTGAGGGSVEGAKGALTICVANSYGVYIFTRTNCISAQLSNNARFPFNFKEIVGSSGLSSLQAVSYEGNQNSAYAFTASGFQQISHNGAKTIWTDLHENGLNTPVWNSTVSIPSTPTKGKDGKVRSVKIVSVASKYVCISIANRAGTLYDQCWIYDIALARWGRIVVDHLELFEDEYYNMAVITTDRRYLTIDSPFAEYPYRAETVVPVIALGRYQYSRQRVTQLLGAEIENLYPVDQYDSFGNKYAENVYPKVYYMSSQDGKSGSWKEMIRNDSTSQAFAFYGCNTTAINHTVMIEGQFNLNSMMLTFAPGGGR